MVFFPSLLPQAPLPHNFLEKIWLIISNLCYTYIALWKMCLSFTTAVGMLNCFTILMYSLETDRGRVLVLFNRRLFIGATPVLCHGLQLHWKAQVGKKKEQIMKQNSWIWVHLSLVLEKSCGKVVVLFSMNLSPFISIAHFFSPHN